MENDQRIDTLLEQNEEILKQLTLIQAVLLELSQPAIGAELGANNSAVSSDCPMSGCEDQTIEPSGALE